MFVANRLWQLLHAPEFPNELFAQSLSTRIIEVRDLVSRGSTAEQIPFTRSVEGIRYFTFAGQLVNKAIGLITRKPSFQADDLSLLVSSPVDWTTVPGDPDAYRDIFTTLFAPSSEQSLYQQQLPSDLQLRECLQDWLRDQTVPQVLARLAGGVPVKVEAAAFSDFAVA
jgi:ATP-dependent helicase Lhr and Lhr-like helicase